MTSTATFPPAPARRRVAGLTLIELMVTTAVAGILSAAAYPSFLEQLRKSRRTDAQAALMQAAEFLERSYTDSLRYDQTSAGAAVALPASLTAAPRDGATKHYTISLQSVAVRSFVLQAVPQGAQSGDRCGTLRLDNVGAKTAALDSCWVR
jgi:type IV pilus assembly protein PilE